MKNFQLLFVFVLLCGIFGVIQTSIDSDSAPGDLSSSISDPVQVPVSRARLRINRILGLIGKLHREHKNLQEQIKTETIAVESYGEGKGHGHGGYGHGAITLDPVSIISLLALGAFLINNILQLLRANQSTPTTGRHKLDSQLKKITSIFYNRNSNKDHYEKSRILRDEDGPSFSEFFENVGSLYYLQPKKRNICIKKVVCNYMSAHQARDESQSTFKSKIFDIMLSTITKFVAPELNPGKNEEELCHKFNSLCSDTVLHDAKITTENKVFSQVTNIISGLAFSNMLSG